jgi:hypothetical protein
MSARKGEAGLMPIRLAETFAERLEYCRILLRVHQLITETESQRVKQVIKDGKCQRGDKDKMEEVA